MTGENLKQILLDKGYKLADLAKALDISPQALNGRLSVKAVKLDFIKEIEDALNINITDDNNRNSDYSELIRLLQKKDEQIDRLISLLEKERSMMTTEQKVNAG